jgi:RND family efflux transporter MFP subunit
MSEVRTPLIEARPAFGPQRRYIVITALLLLALCAFGWCLWNRLSQDAPAEAPRPALTVSEARPERVIWQDKISASGVIAPWQEASIGTQIGNYQLIEVRVNVGDRVRRGQLLARLDPALLKAQESQLLARYDQAVANDRRAQGLQEAEGISEQEALSAATEARMAKALLDAKRLELRYTAILAPDNGVISARSATLGAVVPPGQELFRLIRQQRLEWRGELIAEQLGNVRAGQTVALALPDGTNVRAIVRQVAPSMDAQSRLAIVFADVAPGGAAHAGMYVTGEIATGKSSALAVPAECVVIRDGRGYVAIIVSDKGATKIALRAVATGRRHGAFVEIVHGLDGKERLVRRGAAFLNDGDVVEIAPRKARS